METIKEKIIKNWPILLLLSIVLVLFWPMIFSNKLFPGFDLLLVFYPYSFYFLQSQSLWVSGILSGFNIGATPSAFAGNWIYYFLARRIGADFFDFISFYNILIFFYFVLTAFFSYLAARLLNFDKWVSVLITSIYIFSAYNLSWMVNVVTAASLFIFPAVVYFLLKFRKTFNWFWPFLGGLVLGLALITSHPQFALIGIFGGFLFSLFLTFGDRPFRYNFLLAFLLICLVGFATSSFQLIPEYQISQLTQRGAALSFQESQECALGLFDFARYLIPNFGFNVSCESLLYVGILPLILAVLAIIYVKTDREKILFWAFLLGFALLFSIKYSPIAWLFHQMPVWNGLRGPARFIMLGNFALAVLTGYGFNWILSTYGRSPEGRENKENFKNLKIFKWIRKIFFMFLSLIVVINVLSLFKGTFIKWAQIYFDNYYYKKTIGLSIEHYHRAIENLIASNFYAFSFLNKDFSIPLTLAIFTFLILIFIHKFNKTTLFYAFLLSGFIWAVSSPMVSSGLTRDFFRETEISKFLEIQKPPFRIYSLMPNLSTYQLLVLVHEGVTEYDQNEFLKAMLLANLSLVYGLDSIDGYDVSMPRRTAGVLSELLSERATIGNKIAEARLKPEEKIKIFESRANLLSMMNVKYIISAYSLDKRVFKRVFKTNATRFNIPVYIYENPNVLPRFYFAKKVNFVKPDEEKTLQDILKPGIDFSAEVFIECGSPEDCGQNKNIGGKIISFEYKDGYLRLNAESSTGGWFIFSESYDRNWQAKINNSVVPIYRANYIYQAVKVSVGRNIIEFIYRP